MGRPLYFMARKLRVAKHGSRKADQWDANSQRASIFLLTIR